MPLPGEAVSSRPPAGLWRWSRGALLVLAVLVALVLVVRLAAPSYVKGAINRRLGQIPSYSGRVDRVSLHVWRGAYRIDGMRIVKSNGQVQEPFFSAERIDFSIAWRDLFHGRLVSHITVRNGTLNFLRGPSDESSQLAADKRWQDVINDLFPIDITYLDIRGGVLRFVDTTHTPQVDISVRDLNVHATGLQNRPTSDTSAFPAKIDISGVTLGDGQLRLFTKLEPLAAKPHFELAMELKKMSLPALNDFLRAYAKVDVSRGQFDVFAQMAMREGHYEGYVKPFFTNLSFSEPKDGESLGHRIWESIVSGVADLAKNKDSKQIATRIPFSGEADGLDVHTWKTIENGLHHGFVRALSRGFEGTANPDHVNSGVKTPDKAATPKS
jgi:hypothetical protein